MVNFISGSRAFKMLYNIQVGFFFTPDDETVILILFSVHLNKFKFLPKFFANPVFL